MYKHGADGQWKTEPEDRPWTAPWNYDWIKLYKPASTYLFVRHDVLNGVAVNVYIYTYHETWGGPTRVDNVIWIGARDHLPRRIVSRDTDAHGILQSILVETIGDFNGPIKVTVPAVAVSDPSTHAHPNDKH